MVSDETMGIPRPKCPNCDFINVTGARFCSNCGTRLDESAVVDATGAMPDLATDDAQSGPNPRIPTPDKGAILMVRKGPDAGVQFPLEADIVSVGRSPDSDVFLDDVTVSRNHAEILHTSTGWLVRDKRSLNGTYVNRSRVEEQRLNPGDEVQIGKYAFTFWAAE